MTQRKARPHPTRRLLLIAATGFGAGVAGAVLSLAVSDAAHASDTTPPRLTPPGLSLADAVQDVNAAAPKQAVKLPAPASRVIDRKTRLVDQAAGTTTRAVQKATVRTDRTIRPAPIADRVVDTVSDVSDRALDTVNAPLPHVGDVPIHLPLDRPTPPLAPSGTETAPEPVMTGPPMPPTAGSGAPIPLATRQQHPAVGAADGSAAPRRGDAPTSAKLRAAGPGTPSTGSGTWGEHPGAGAGATPHTTQVADSPSRWSTSVDLWRRAITRYVQHHAGRTPPPTPPSG